MNLSDQLRQAADRIDELEAENARLKGTSGEDLEKLTAAVDLGIKQAKVFDRFYDAVKPVIPMFAYRVEWAEKNQRGDDYVVIHTPKPITIGMCRRVVEAAVQIETSCQELGQ